MRVIVSNSTVEIAKIYVANGNRLGVVLLRNPMSETALRQNANLRQWLMSWGQLKEVDSVMVVRLNVGGLVADVFEPWAQTASGLPGDWSTMCGNGMMAAACFYEEYVRILTVGEVLAIQTRSGTRIVSKLSQATYSVCMGAFTHQMQDLTTYIQLDGETNQLLNVPLPSNLSARFSKSWSIGLSGDRRNGVIDGEPHVVLVGENDSLSPSQLRHIAIAEGPKITKNLRLFPSEINTNFAIVQSPYSAENGLRVLACTHERGLGSNAERSVTGACGTGATAIGATLYQLYSLTDGNIVHISMPRGNLSVYRRNGQFYLVGSVDT